MAKTDEVIQQEQEQRIRGIEAEIEDFEERYDYFSKDQWIEWSMDWLQYLVLGVSSAIKEYDLLTDNQKARIKDAIRKLRILRPKIEEKGYEYPEILDKAPL